MEITIKTVPHKEQRYPTVGDWFFVRGKLRQITVSDMKNEDYEFLVGIHEAIEAWLCSKVGITEKEVNDFDGSYEICREYHLPLLCGCKIQDECGMDPHAPYHKEHVFATEIEKMIAKKLKVNWSMYGKKINDL
jgi:hypothetical protein